MRSLFLVALGIAAGIVGTILWTTLDPTLDSNEPETALGGNARVSLSEDALARIIEQNLADLPAAEAMRVSTEIREDGIVAVSLAAGTGALAVRATLETDPDVVDGRLKLNVVSSSLGKLALPEEIVERIERPLQARLDDLSGGLEYQLRSISTAEHRLTLEIEI
ncbi:MAG: hypothetical protein IT302_05280 [Dehalococcoidia bacterium]|nr:hypothetical protein [Dehalococcoidia bacterium]